MSKLMGELSYKDWMILKHGLKNSIDKKENVLFLESLTSWEPYKLSKKEKEKLEKELKEEKATLERVTVLTDSFKNMIDGNIPYYCISVQDNILLKNNVTKEKED